MMKKEKLIRFINKYSLDNIFESVKWKHIAAEKVLHTRGELQQKSFVMDVRMKDFTEFNDDVVIPVVNTQKIKAMISPFEEDIALTLSKVGDRVVGFTVSDQNCESYCTAADPNAIPPVPKDLSDKEIYEVNIALTEEFVEKFSKARAALPDVEEFTIRMNKNDKVEFVIGYSVANTNRITLTAPTINGKDKFDGQPIKFVAKNFLEVLKANKEVTDGVMYLTSRGVIKTVFKGDDFDCLYFQFATLKK